MLKSHWPSIILFGFIGQLVWNIENLYFNTFLYNYIGGTTTDIATMVSLSAITATVTTLFIGALSDKINRRKIFICVGTVLWGLSTLSFAFISRENVALIMKNASIAQVTSVSVMIVIIMDCIMTFFGSGSNDGAFNSWVTDITDNTNRAKVEGVLSALPLIGMLVVVGAAGLLIEILGYEKFFFFLGTGVIICGLLGFVMIKESRNGQASDQNYWASIVHGFKPSVIKENKNLYRVLLALAIFNIGIQIYMPYLVIYLDKYLGFTALEYSAALALGVIASSIVGMSLGGKIDKYGIAKFIPYAFALYCIGLIVVYFSRSFTSLLILFPVVLIGNVLIAIILQSSIRKYTPEENTGLFQGIRMIAQVLLPMGIGPFIGNMVIKSSNETFINEFNEIVAVPVPLIFLVGGLFSLLTLVPLLYKKD